MGQTIEERDRVRRYPLALKGGVLSFFVLAGAPLGHRGVVRSAVGSFS